MPGNARGFLFAPGAAEVLRQRKKNETRSRRIQRGGEKKEKKEDWAAEEES